MIEKGRIIGQGSKSEIAGLFSFDRGMSIEEMYIAASDLEKLLKIKLVLHFSVCVIFSFILALLFCEKFSVVYLIHSDSLFIV